VSEVFIWPDTFLDIIVFPANITFLSWEHLLKFVLQVYNSTYEHYINLILLSSKEFQNVGNVFIEKFPHRVSIYSRFPALTVLATLWDPHKSWFFNLFFFIIKVLQISKIVGQVTVLFDLAYNFLLNINILFFNNDKLFDLSF